MKTRLVKFYVKSFNTFAGTCLPHDILHITAIVHRLQKVPAVPAVECLLISGERSRELMEWASFVILNEKFEEINHKGMFMSDHEHTMLCSLPLHFT